MMKNDGIYLEHIMESLRKILLYTDELTLADFLENTMVQDACIRQFEIVGEATKRLSERFREKYTNVPWKSMAGMRDKLIHDYIDVDLDIVWITCKEDAIMLLIELEKISHDLKK